MTTLTQTLCQMLPEHTTDTDIPGRMPGDPNQYDVLFMEEARWRQYNKDYESHKPSSMIKIHLTPKPNSKLHLVNSPVSVDWCYALVMSSCDKCGSGGLDYDCLQWCYDMHAPCRQVTASNDWYSLNAMVVVDIFIIVHTVDIVQKRITVCLIVL